MQILGPGGEVLFEKMSANAALFHFNVTKPGIYSFILNNEKVKQIYYD